MLAAGFTSLLWTAHHSNGRSPAVATPDPDATTWNAAPVDPLGPSSNRHIVNGDGDLVLIAEITDSAQVETTFIYSWNRGWQTPQRIPAQTSESFLTTSAFILPVRLRSRSGFPGVYSPGSGTFTPITPPKPTPAPRLELAADVVLSDDILRDGLLLDTAARCSRLDAFPGHTRTQAAGAAIGTTPFIWGGSHSPRQDLADGYLLYRR